MDFKTLLSGFLENSPLVWNWLFCKRPYSFSVNGDSSRKKGKKESAMAERAIFSKSRRRLHKSFYNKCPDQLNVSTYDLSYKYTFFAIFTLSDAFVQLIE